MAKPRREIIDRFAERYSMRGSDVYREIEQKVIGGVFGANGYTTKAQADALIDTLDLNPGSRVLDLGAGRGWPGLYVAEQAGCDVILADLPEPGLRTALKQALRKNIEDLAQPVMAAGERLPFKRQSFDAVIHSDVL
jgi:ubiquinone/menaquinone biosynthesis C-methylase UbiE